MRVGDVLQARDPAEVLRGECGVFLAVLPSGEEFKITAEPGRSIINLKFLGHDEPRTFRIEKIAELGPEQLKTKGD